MSADELTDLEQRIARMWEGGLDTLDIANTPHINLKESKVYAMLPRIREIRRRQRAQAAEAPR